ncbi:MAG: MBL fold metallo-hydrolase [Bacteroidetes bacterium]|nr:MBL fold metallo-hydrolase [Bacteroidota bacterium]MBK8680580.1 MBL fold metallo-hydrolase [Bacteroidota bacterium]
MYIEQMYTNCLAAAAYYIESNGEAAVIDPLRETDPYIEKAKSRGAKIKYVFETHFHADFVSGHIDLARKTGATIVYGPEAATEYSVYNAKDGEEFKLGAITFKVLHTPGHTLESSCYLLSDENGKPHSIFTGDTLFVGDVGRPDLLDGYMTKEELANMMYDSLNNKIKVLADDVIMYPAHGPGSACGKSMGAETYSTIGIQKKTNYALQPMSRENFILKVTEGLSAPPAYFFKDAAINKKGYDAIDDVMKRNTSLLTVAEFEDAIDHAIILDTRVADEFEKGFIPGSLNIGLDGMFAVWVGSLVDIHKPILVVTAPGKEEESILRLARVGYEHVEGVLNGGIESWKNAGKTIDKVKSIHAEEVKNYYNKPGYKILDARKPGEYETSHIDGAINIELNQIENRMGELDSDCTYIMHCAAGYRSMIASSILKKNGKSNFINVTGGYNALQNTDLPKEASVIEVV